MQDNNQKQSPMFAQVNIGRASDENRQKASVRHERYQYIKLTYPNGVTLTLPGDTEPDTLAGYVRIKV